MKGRNKPLIGKRRPKSKKPGSKPNATRQRHLAKKRKQYFASALYARKEAAKLAASESAE